MSIQVQCLHRQLKAAELPLEKLASNPQCPEAEKLAEASREFEAILLRQIFTEAQKPVFKSRYSQSSVANDVYRDLITNELAQAVSRSGCFGLARGLEDQLQRQAIPETESKRSPAPIAPKGAWQANQKPSV